MFKVIYRNKTNFSKVKDSCKLKVEDLKSVISSLSLGEIKHNIEIRKHDFPFDTFSHMVQNFNSDNVSLAENISDMMKKLPNTVSPTTPIGDESKSEILKFFNKSENLPGINVETSGHNLSQLRVNNVQHVAESRAYYFTGDFARLERALIRYTLSHLQARGFKMISVPDVIATDMVEKSGFEIDPDKNQIYNVITDRDQIQNLFRSHNLAIDTHKRCLAGTSELALASYLSDSVFDYTELPVKLCALSRCYRREVTNLESHLYRVHQFNKVEIFCVSRAEESENMFRYIVGIQEELFSQLGIGYKVINMASEELGNSAHQKIDIEAWMPGDKKYGEISSASNCTDYQSSRFNILYEDPDTATLQFAHTLNGTGCAVPRLLKAIVECNQTDKGHVIVPLVLRKYMGNVEKITRQHPPHRPQWIKRLDPGTQ